jgi:menaquinone-9 beta-reductase
VTRRATLRGAERTPIPQPSADVLVCGASFAGLAVARELAGSGADVLLVDRYEIGERATSACAAPRPWLDAMGVADAIVQELPCMSFTTPHGSVRYRLPWSWAAFDYRELCRLLFEQCDARFEIATVVGRADDAVETDRGPLRAPLVVDALGWRRVLAREGRRKQPARPDARGSAYQPPDAPLSRGLEVHPPSERAVPAGVRSPAGGEDLDVWVERSLVRYGYGWSVPAGGEQRVGAGSYEPRHHVKRPTVELAARLDRPPVRFQGNWFPHRLRRAAEDGVFFVGDSAGHCFPLSGEGIRTAFYFGIACGRELHAVLAGERTREEALRRYARFSASHRHAFGAALRLQWLIPRLPPRALTLLLRALGRQTIVDRAFRWYLDQARPEFALTTTSYAAAATRERSLVPAGASQEPSSTPRYSRP